MHGSPQQAFQYPLKKPNQNSFNDGKQQNNFVPSSNISNFLLTKGSSGNLKTFENEYSYQINLGNLGGQQLVGQISKGHIPGKKEIFNEVVHEDDAEEFDQY